jgi:glycosyltransferase involved in cell wall biosynthesis
VTAQSLLGIPAVVSIRGDDEYRLRLSAINRLLVPGIYRRARYLIAQSPHVLDDLHAQFRLAGQATLSEQLQRKIKVISNGIYTSFGIRSSGDKVIYVGRLIRKKGIADLLLAMRQLPDVEVLIVGDGPDRPRLESLAQGMSVTFTGQVMPSSVRDYLQQARVLVLPSYLGDGLPNAILEAMACGVPVVATRTAGIPDLVQHGETGFLFKTGDIQQLAYYMERLLGDDRLWRSFGDRSVQAVQSYSWDLVVPQIERLLWAAVSPAQHLPDQTL